MPYVPEWPDRGTRRLSLAERDRLPADVGRRNEKIRPRIAERHRRRPGQVAPRTPRPHHMPPALEVLHDGRRDPVFEEQDPGAAIHLAAGAKLTEKARITKTIGWPVGANPQVLR